MAKKSTLPAIPNPAEISLDKLSVEFELFITSVNEEIAADAPLSLTPAPEVLSQRDPDDAVLAKRDRLMELLFAFENQELRLRGLVQAAERQARHYKALRERMLWSFEAYMLTSGIKMIPGLVHRLALYNQADRLVVVEENRIPAKYWIEKQVVERTLNTELLLSDLQAGEEIDGCHLDKNRTRVDLK